MWGGGSVTGARKAPSQDSVTGARAVWSASLRSFGLIFSGCFFRRLTQAGFFFVPHFLKLSTGLVCKSAV